MQGNTPENEETVLNSKTDNLQACLQGRLLLPLSQATAHTSTAHQPVSNPLLLNSRTDNVQACLQGRTPDNEETVALFHLLSQANVDLRQPVSLEQQLMEDNDMDADVGLAMVQLLKVCVVYQSLTSH